MIFVTILYKFQGKIHRLSDGPTFSSLPKEGESEYTIHEVKRMDKYLHGGHTRYDIKIHVVWITKYRYPVLRKEVGYRLRDLLRQGCEARNIGLLAGHIRPDHVHLLLSISPMQSVSQVVKYLKGRSSHLLQDEFPSLKKRYWGQHLWARGYFCVSVGEMTEDMITDYINKQAEEDGRDFQVTE